MTFDSIINRGEFFSNHYLDAVIGGDLGDLHSRWDDMERRDVPTGRAGLRSMSREFFAARGAAAEAGPSRRADTARAVNAVVLGALGYRPERTRVDLARTGNDTVSVEAAHVVETGGGLWLLALDAGFATDVDQLFASNGDDSGRDEVGLVDPVWREGDKRAFDLVPDAIGAIFATDDPPRYVLVAAGTIVVLAERAKWAEGRFLAFDVDGALERNDTRAKGEIETIAALFSAEVVVPADGQSVLDELVERSYKHAVGVSKELRVGIRESIEILANEVIRQRLATGRAVYEGANAVDARELTRQSLRWLFRLVVLLFTESRPDLGVLPVNDEAYMEGYSLDRLRELISVDLDSDRARNGSHLHESLDRLFELVNNGYHAESAQQAMFNEHIADDGRAGRSDEMYLLFPGLDAALFSPDSTRLLDSVTLRNEALQQVLRRLMLAEGRTARDQAGYVSYAQLGINQLGAVYEGLMAYGGFFATEDLFEVAKGGDAADGTWMVPVAEADDYPDEVFVTATDALTGRDDRVLHPKGSFVFRLSGRDRQRSASYYTPEVLTRCVVKHALAELLGLDDYAPADGSSGITEAEQLLDITICEPALGSGAFANEAINQLSEEYLRRRQGELGESLEPERYRRELQRVKAHFALHQTYGVDLNATAVELAEVSLWLNCMHPGLKAPWFGLQLRAGNSLIGCRRSTWRAGQLGDKPWKETRNGRTSPPVDRRLGDGPLDADEIHHFLLPGHGWGAVASRKEAKELRPHQTKALKEWTKKILAAPGRSDAKRLGALAAAVEQAWASAEARIALTQQALRRPIDIYGATVADRAASISRAEAERVLTDPDSPLGRLRTLMDAWVGLWFWPLDADTTPPSWDQWLRCAEDLLRPDERHGPAGQLDLFDDLADLLAAQDRLNAGHPSNAEITQRHPWLAVAVAAARREGAFHWDLEFAPVFQRGGFDLQVGNPPWVRPRWYEDLVLAESDPWWGITDKAPAAELKARRSLDLADPHSQADYVSELESAAGVVEIVGSPIERPVLAGIQTNLYMVFMDTAWRHLSDTGVVGLLHPESHFTDPKAGALRRATYGHLRRHWQHTNHRKLFEDVTDTEKAYFGIHIYGSAAGTDFIQLCMAHDPSTIDRSLGHDGSGPLPGIQYPQGGWDLRPHRSRVLTITEEVLADWARLFDEPGTPAAEARLLRPVTTADLDALSVLAAQPTRLADHEYHWTRGHEEDRAKTDGIIRWDTKVPDSWDEVILQGPHFTIATPFAKQPNENCKNNKDYTEWDLESLPERVIPRTNYQRACDREKYEANLDHWNGRPATSYWRFAWRRMTQPGLERSLQGCLIPSGPAHVHTVHTMALQSAAQTAVIAGLWASLPLDYLVKVSGKADIQDELINRFPAAMAPLALPLTLRTLRLNCLTADFAPLWEELFDPAWRDDQWTDPSLTRLALGDVDQRWSMATPLRRDQERRMALVELDALAALMLGLSAEQLCGMYRTQFAVLRKYEYKMVFDAEGRKICGYHQSAGFRQSQLQDQAKAGDLPLEWKNLWKLYEQYEQDPSSVDWLGLYVTPFTRADRELEMTRAYNEFQHRLDESAPDRA